MPAARPPGATEAETRASAAHGRREAKVLAWDSDSGRITNDGTANSLVDTPSARIGWNSPA